MNNEDSATQQKIEKIKSRIENLMRRAAHPNTPQPERELCQQQIEKLTVRYSITEASLSTEDQESASRQIFTFDFTLTNDHLPQRYRLLNAVASPLGVQVIFNRKLSQSGTRAVRSNSGYLIGAGDRPNMAWEIYDSIDNQMESVRFIKAGTRAAAQRSFMIGFSDEIQDRARAFYAEVAEEMDADVVKSAELVLVSDKERIDEIVKSNGTTTAKPSKAKVEFDSYFAGVSEGQNADITLDSNKIKNRDSIGAGV